MTDAFAAPRFARSFAGSFFGRRFAFTARGVFAVCRCVAAILPLASPFSSRFYCRLRFVWRQQTMVWRQQTMVWWGQTMVWWEQTIVWRQQTISCPSVRPSCVYFRKKKSGAKAVESATAARKTAADASLFSSRGRLKEVKPAALRCKIEIGRRTSFFYPSFCPVFISKKFFICYFCNNNLRRCRRAACVDYLALHFN